MKNMLYAMGVLGLTLAMLTGCGSDTGTGGNANADLPASEAAEVQASANEATETGAETADNVSPGNDSFEPNLSPLFEGFLSEMGFFPVVFVFSDVFFEEPKWDVTGEGLGIFEGIYLEDPNKPYVEVVFADSEDMMNFAFERITVDGVELEGDAREEWILSLYKATVGEHR